jgi:D-serine deaminase-like pyridoxal phosphate-dependent protein
MVIEAGQGHGFKINDILFAVPIHICPTVAMYDFAHIVTGDALKTRWPITARSRSVSI